MTNCETLRRATLLAIMWLAATGSSFAQGNKSGEWEYQLVPLYLWGVSVDGQAKVKSAPIPVTAPLEIDFKDAVKDLSAVFTVYFEGRNPRWGYYGNFSYLKLTPKSELPTGQTMNVDFRNPFVEVAGLYRLGEAGRSPWWAVGGVRYLGVDMNVSGLPSPPLPINSLGVKMDVVDVFGGVRFQKAINDRWGVFGQADIGTGDSERSWSTTLYATYRFHKQASVLAGWRWLDYKISDSKMDLDLRMSGPLIAVSFDW